MSYDTEYPTFYDEDYIPKDKENDKLILDTNN